MAKLSVSNPFSFFCRRDALSGEDVLNLASFLGEQLRNLHLLPCPPFNESSLSDKLKTEPPFNNGFVEDVVDTSSVPAEWEIFIRTLARKKKNLVNRLTAWYVNIFFSTLCLFISTETAIAFGDINISRPLGLLYFEI